MSKKPSKHEQDRLGTSGSEKWSSEVWYQLVQQAMTKLSPIDDEFIVKVEACRRQYDQLPIRDKHLYRIAVICAPLSAAEREDIYHIINCYPSEGLLSYQTRRLQIQERIEQRVRKIHLLNPDHAELARLLQMAVMAEEGLTTTMFSEAMEAGVSIYRAQMLDARERNALQIIESNSWMQTNLFQLNPEILEQLQHDLVEAMAKSNTEGALYLYRILGALLPPAVVTMLMRTINDDEVQKALWFGQYYGRNNDKR